MFLLDLLQALLAPDLATFLAVFSWLVQHCQQEAAITKLVSPKSLLLSLSKLMDGKTSLGSLPMANLLVSSYHWLSHPGWQGGGCQPFLPGPPPLPHTPPGEDPAMADQFLKGETMSVYQVVAATRELQLHNLLLKLQFSASRRYLLHRHCLPLEELVCHGWVLSRRRVGKRRRPRKERLTASALPARVGKPMVGGDQEVSHWD